MEAPAAVVTERLRLRMIDTADVPALFPIFNDAAGWWYDPPGRHLDVARTRSWVERAGQRWTDDGLSYWTVREGGSDEVVGVGGVQRHATGSWNLYYRIATSRWGLGYATEVARAALAAARDHDDGVAVIAWIAEHNEPSRRVAARVGLRDAGLRIDANDGQARLAYTDRVLPPA